MKRLLAFNSQNWESVHSYSATAGTIGDIKIPIAPTECPFLMEESIIAAYASATVPEGRTWRTGGWLEAVYQTGLTVGGSQDAVGGHKRFLLNKITVIFLPQNNLTYSAKIYFPKWLDDVNFQLWKYTGVDDTDLEVYLSQEIENINFKLDQLAAN